MISKIFFSLIVSFSIILDGTCQPQGCSCRSACQPPAPPPAQSQAPSCSSCPPVVPIALDNCGPNPCPLPPINAPPIQTPVVEKAPITLPACIPPPKTYANTCHCVKTVVKPQVVQQVITVPSIQRYIQTTHTPVVEHIHYQGIPINCPPYTPEAPAPAPACPPPPLPPSPFPCAPAAAAPAVPPCLPAAPPALPPCLPAAPPALPPCLPAAPPALPPCLAALARSLSPCIPALPRPPCLPCMPLPPCAPPRLPVSPALLNILKAISSSPCLQSLLRKLI